MFESSWHGYEAKPLEFEGREAIVVFPKEVREGAPWTLKAEYRTAFPDVELRLLAEGFHVAFVQNETRWATEAECALKARFVRYVSETFHLAPKCIPVGMSCGGAYAVKFAGLYPELVQCMYIDAPVLNFCSVPGKSWNKFNDEVWHPEFVKAYPGIQRWQLPGFQGHPICYANVLIRNRIPVILVWGKEDLTVPYEENGLLLEQAMEGTGLLKVFPVPSRGHHPHGFIGDNQPIVDFIKEHCQ